MTQSISLRDKLVDAARGWDGFYKRSPAQQLEYLVAFGKVIETAFDFPVEAKGLAAVGRTDLERVLGEVETIEGLDKAREVILRSCGSIVSHSVPRS